MRKRVLSVLAGLAVAAAVAACGSNSDTTATDTGSPAGSPTGTTLGSAPPKDVTCSYPADGDPAKQVQPPPAQPLAGGTVQATIKTSEGDVPITLDADKAPCTVNSFVSLAQQGFFDSTPCHRLTTAGIYVLQCGDPSGTGRGGPGYSFADEVSPTQTYPPGTLAMANAGPDTNGSQFFLCYGSCENLNGTADTPAAYTVFGQISKAGLEVLTKVAQAGTADGGPDGAPKDHVEITGVTLG